jgi:hypothetical protein
MLGDTAVAVLEDQRYTVFFSKDEQKKKQKLIF